jgi:hypothetical protein
MKTIVCGFDTGEKVRSPYSTTNDDVNLKLSGTFAGWQK